MATSICLLLISSPVPETFAERDRDACREGSVHLVRGKTNCLKQEKIVKSKTSSRFPTLRVSNAWQMGHNSRQGWFLEQELLLDFPAWIDLTSNADKFEVTEHILLL